jgi:hypothetical protein
LADLTRSDIMRFRNEPAKRLGADLPEKKADGVYRDHSGNDETLPMGKPALIAQAKDWTHDGQFWMTPCLDRIPQFSYRTLSALLGAIGVNSMVRPDVNHGVHKGWLSASYPPSAVCQPQQHFLPSPATSSGPHTGE